MWFQKYLLLYVITPKSTYGLLVVKTIIVI